MKRLLFSHCKCQLPQSLSIFAHSQGAFRNRILFAVILSLCIYTWICQGSSAHEPFDAFLLLTVFLWTEKKGKQCWQNGSPLETRILPPFVSWFLYQSLPETSSQVPLNQNDFVQLAFLDFLIGNILLRGQYTSLLATTTGIRGLSFSFTEIVLKNDWKVKILRENRNQLKLLWLSRLVERLLFGCHASQSLLVSYFAAVDRSVWRHCDTQELPKHNKLCKHDRWMSRQSLTRQSIHKSTHKGFLNRNIDYFDDNLLCRLIAGVARNRYWDEIREPIMSAKIRIGQWGVP